MKNLVTAFLFIATVLAREYKEYDHLDCIGNDIHQVEAREVDSLPNLYWTAWGVEENLRRDRGLCGIQHPRLAEEGVPRFGVPGEREPVSGLVQSVWVPLFM